MKVVISVCHGRFSLSEAACEYLGLDPDDYYSRYYQNRDGLNLVECVEALGLRASGDCARLVVVEIPDDVEYTIENDDGAEWIAEVHRTWEG